MARPDKTATVAELAEAFRGSHAAVLTEYRGLSVAQLKALRQALGADTSYAVVKNTLTKIAAREAGVTVFEDLLQGPSAIAFVKGDPVEAAKGLRDFAKANPMLVIKGGVLDGTPLSPAELARLADLESREVLLARLAGALQAPLQNVASLVAAPLAQAARLLAALRVERAERPDAGQEPDPQPGPATGAAQVAGESAHAVAAESTHAVAAESTHAVAAESTPATAP